MNNRVEEILVQLKQRLWSGLAADMVRVTCFGSYARGEETADSDLDVLVVVRQKDETISDFIREQAYAVMWSHDFDPVLSVKIFSEEEWNHLARLNSSFYESLQKEGIAV
jgi:predicted nucleotidyltransferase